MAVASHLLLGRGAAGGPQGVVRQFSTREDVLTHVYRRRTRFLVAALAFSLLAAACGGDDGGGASAGESGEGGSESLSGEITISGSSTVEPITALNAEIFSEQNPDLQISVDGPGTSDGFELFCQGKLEISDASRPIEAEEIKACKKEGVEFIEVKVGIDGISVLTSPDFEGPTCLDFKDMYALVGPESEGFANWSDANELAQEIGAGNAPYPDVPLDITAPGEESGTYDTFVEFAIEETAEAQGLPEDEWVTRPDYQSSGNDNVIIQGLQGSDSSFGWVGFAFYEENQDTVKAFEVDGGDGCVAPTTETIESKGYPMSRDLFFYVNADDAKSNESVKAFVDFYLSDEGLKSVVDTGYVALPDDQLQESIDVWENQETGSREEL